MPLFYRLFYYTSFSFSFPYLIYDIIEREKEEKAMDNRCLLCPRQCNTDRNRNKGYCGETNTVRLARAALHFYEEPCISGTVGSGAIFFSGCNLKCVFCQNYTIAGNEVGKEVSAERLAQIMLELQLKGCANINLVTPTHYVPSIKEALILAKSEGLTVPIVYNTSGYELVSTLRMLNGLVDIYLPDFKYSDNFLAKEYSNAPDYFEIASAAVHEMYNQVQSPVIGSDGLMQKGVIVRHLLLPLGVKNARGVIDYLHETYGENIYLSIMNQYTPMEQNNRFNEICKKYPQLARRVTQREYNRVIDYALSLNIKNCFIQEGMTASDSFIPAFDYTGI